MSTQLDVDIAALVGEMEAPPCESIDHAPADKYHDDGAAAFYVRLQCPDCNLSVVKAYCKRFIAFIQNDGKLRCPCGTVRPALDIAKVLGPVNA